MWIVFGTIGIVLGTIGLGLVIDRMLRPRDQLATRSVPLLHAPGDAPATAIAYVKLRPPRCCRAMAETGRERVRYGEGELVVVRFACARCGTVRSIYVTEDRA